jgi:hypothetical protein
MESSELFDKARDYFYGDENEGTEQLEDELEDNGIDVDLVWELLDDLLENVVKATVTPKPFPENRMNFVKDVVMPTE